MLCTTAPSTDTEINIQQNIHSSNTSTEMTDSSSLKVESMTQLLYWMQLIVQVYLMMCNMTVNQFYLALQMFFFMLSGTGGDSNILCGFLSVTRELNY